MPPFRRLALAIWRKAVLDSQSRAPTAPVVLVAKTSKKMK
jgi:hypothetical protein